MIDVLIYCSCFLKSFKFGAGLCLMQVLRLYSDVANNDMNTVPAALSQPVASSQSARDTNFVRGVKLTDYRMEELNEPPPRLPGVRALLPLSGGLALLTAGSDCQIRMWDRLRLAALVYNQSHIIFGLRAPVSC